MSSAIASSANELHSSTSAEDASSTQSKLRSYRNPSLQVGKERQIRLVEAPIEEPKEGEALVHIKTTGICGSDVHLWKSGGIGPLRVESDYILGHEAAGIVLKLGEGITNVKVGDRVAIEPNIVCGNCFLCRDGRYNLCQDVQFSGVYPANGTLQRFKVHPAKWLHKIPDILSYRQGALLEPLSVVMHGINCCRLSLGRGVSIHGAGPIGLSALACARASGAHPIVITDLEPARLDFAKRLVPSCTTYQVDKSLNAEENANKIRAIFGAGPVSETKAAENEYSAPERTLECTGVESSVATAAYTCRRGGTVMVIGVGKSMMDNVPFMHLSLAEVST